ISRISRADPVQIRVAWVAPGESFPSMWLFKKELARHFGTSYVFEPMHFASTPPMVTAIANNEVQIGELAYSTLPIAIKNAGLDDIRVIADDLQDGVDGYWTARFAVLKDRPIKKVGAPQPAGLSTLASWCGLHRVERSTPDSCRGSRHSDPSRCANRRDDGRISNGREVPKH